jgi:ornithine cyclodeaminase/alanine dehydrogenase-like protein (mu-crystallin family)
MLHIRPVETVKVYTPDPEKASKFVEKQKARFKDVEIRVVNNPKEAVIGSDLVVCATNANTPVFEGEWLEEGTHLTAITGSDDAFLRREVDGEAIKKVNLMAVNSMKQLQLYQRYDISPVIVEDLIAWGRLFELGDIVSGKVDIKKESSMITYHFNNIGLGIQFAAVGARIYERALERNVGTRIPFTWRGRSA